MSDAPVNPVPPAAPVGQLASCEPYHNAHAAATVPPGLRYLHSLRMHYVLDAHGSAFELPGAPE